MTQNLAVCDAHLVGSVNQPSAEATFRAAAGALGPLAPRLPDGEVGERFHWMLFQGARLEATPGLVRLAIDPILHEGFDLRPLVLDGSVAAEDLRVPELGYAAAAVESYAVFARLKSEGFIPAATRFQVCLPSPLAPVTSFVAAALRQAVLPAYEAALIREVEAICAAIPADQLALQIDLATEFGYIEGVSMGGGALEAFFAPADAQAPRIAAAAAALALPLASSVPAGVQLGFHLCYGDVGEKHFVEPMTTEHLVTVAQALNDGVGRRIDWIHLPVPIERDDAAYFAPLARLTLHSGTRLFLGVVHHEDGVEGARRRLAAAAAPLAAAGITAVGVGTECGFGRGPADRTEPLLRLHAEVLAAR
jgi:methionine synthase II (cobalamin-independent)